MSAWSGWRFGLHIHAWTTTAIPHDQRDPNEFGKPQPHNQRRICRCGASQTRVYVDGTVDDAGPWRTEYKLAAD